MIRIGFKIAELKFKTDLSRNSPKKLLLKALMEANVHFCRDNGESRNYAFLVPFYSKIYSEKWNFGRNSAKKLAAVSESD